MVPVLREVLLAWEIALFVQDSWHQRVARERIMRSDSFVVPYYLSRRSLLTSFLHGFESLAVLMSP